MHIEKTLETQRTLLTLLTEEDLPAMIEMAREPDTFKYIKKLQIMTEQQYSQFLQAKLEQIHDRTGFHWAVWLKESLQTNKSQSPAATIDSQFTVAARPYFIGAVNLNPVAGTSMMQIGCQLKRDYWGQGFAFELTRCILDFGISEAGVGLKTVYGLFEKENKASRRILEKLGFVWQETKDSLGIELEIHKYPK
jgi:[ribosomal protein S5]-alanine N-acetyltransferase